MNNFQTYTTRGAGLNSWWVSLALLLTLLGTSSCGGNGETSLLAGGGIGGTGAISVGSITAFGSIWVNGVEYDTINSAITVNGVSASQAELTRGMIVQVKGTVNIDGVSGNAESVTFNRDISGIVSAVDHLNRTITVLGQIIAWDSKTFGDDNDPGAWSAPAIGDYVEISGIPTQTGWLARAINHHDQEIDNDISGVISNLDPMTPTFTIGNLEIQYQANTETILKNGDYIEVTGQMQGNIFNASRLEMRRPELAENNEDMEVEGIVREYNTDTKILIIMGSGGEYTIDTTGAIFENGTEDMLDKGKRIEVEGYIQSELFFAEEIEFKGGE